MRSFTRVSWVVALSLGLGLMSAAGCKKSDDDDDDDDSDSSGAPVGNGGAPGGASKTFGLALPASLAVASPLAAKKGGALRLADAPADAPADEGADLESRQSENEELITATDAAGCAFNRPNPPRLVRPECYGPSIAFEGHPDATDADQATGMLPGGDLGIWDDTTESGEACIAAKMNYEIESVAEKADRAVKTSLMVACAANLASQAMPVESESVDVTSAVVAALEGQEIGGTITAASIAREADVDGRPVYVTTVSLDGDQGTIDVSIRHLALDDANATYKGKLWTTFTGDPGSNGMTTAISVAYEMSAADSMRYELRQSRFAEANVADAFDAAHDVSMPVSNDGYSWGLFDLNPADGTGKVAYGWVAGTSHENMRSFIAEVASGDDGKTGVGYFGFGDSLKNVMADSTRAGWLDRMICNWAGPANDHNGAALVQKQSMAQSELGVFEPTASNISYVPRTSCGVGEAENADYTWHLQVGDDDEFQAFPESHDLVDIDAVDAGDLAVPTAPATF